MHDILQIAKSSSGQVKNTPVVDTVVSVFLERMRELLYSSPNAAGAYNANIVDVDDVVVVLVVLSPLDALTLTHSPRKPDDFLLTHAVEHCTWSPVDGREKDV